MANYVNSNNVFEQNSVLARDCPHCGTHARLIPVSTPDFNQLNTLRANEVGIAFSCSACGRPRFGRLRVHRYENDRIVLSSSIVEIERAKERFPLTYLPEMVRRYFGEALDCYAADCFDAFGSMCRRTVRASFEAIAQRGRERWSVTFDEAVEFGEIDEETAETLRVLLFSHTAPEPSIAAGQAAILIEIMKDILYQCHVRSAKFRAAVKMRRFFAEEDTENDPTFFDGPAAKDSSTLTDQPEPVADDTRRNPALWDDHLELEVH